MKFHLDFTPKISQHQINHQQAVLFVGSCFSEHIAGKLMQLKFEVDSNPFGIIFNPKSIELTLNRIVTKKYFTSTDTFEKEGVWFCLETHTSLFANTQFELLKKINAIIDQWHIKLKHAKWLVITVGSAYAYKHIKQQHIVANCHKLSNTLFEKQLLQANDIVSDYSTLIETIKSANPHLQVLLTVSPVKHLRDGVIENSLSKAILIQAVHQLVSKHINCSYFPAYELVADDLRDYRFYQADMAHPNQQAIDYVWQKFEQTYFSNDTKLLNEKLTNIHLAMQHKPFNSDGNAFLQFKKTYYKKCEALKKQYSWLNIEIELHYFNDSRIIS
jgi:hypothetical protein